jgi:hypothetical protein
MPVEDTLLDVRKPSSENCLGGRVFHLPTKTKQYDS